MDDIIKVNEKLSELRKLSNGSDGVKNILDNTAKIIGNPVAMYDIAYNLWAHTENTVADDPLWNELIMKGRFSHETVDFFKSEKFIEAFAQSPVSLMKSDKLKYDRANGVIFDKNGIQIANILVLACYKPFEDGDFELVNAVCELLSTEIEKSGLNKQTRLFGETFFSKLIEKKAINEKLMHSKITELYSGLEKSVYVAIIDIIQYDNTLTHLAYFVDLFKSMRKDFKYFIYLNNIVVLMSFTGPVNNFEKELNAFNDFFSHYRIYAGISGEFQNLLELNKYFRQALNALNYGMILNDGNNIFSYDIFRIELFVNSHIDEDNISELCHPIVFQIAEHDKKHKTSYLDAIYKFLLCGMNSALSAGRINMNPYDFDTLLKKASEIFEIDWNNGNLMFALFRSIKLLKCFSEKINEIS